MTSMGTSKIGCLHVGAASAFLPNVLPRRRLATVLFAFVPGWLSCGLVG